MNFIVAEDPNNAITDLLGTIRNQYPNSSIYRVHKDNFDSAIKIISKLPMLSSGWLVITNPNKMTVNQIRRLCALEDNLTIFNVTKSSDFDKAVELLTKADVEFKYIDNLHPSKDRIINYITEELNISKDIAKYIAKRCNYYIPRVYESVLMLQVVDGEIDKKVVSKYTTNYGVASVASLVEHIIGYETKNKKTLLGLINNYRYGMPFLFKLVLEEIEQILTGYRLIMTGQLSFKNYSTFKSDELKCSEWKLKKILDYFQVVSYDKLYLIYTLLCAEKAQTVTVMIKYIEGGGL